MYFFFNKNEKNHHSLKYIIIGMYKILLLYALLHINIRTLFILNFIRFGCNMRVVPSYRMTLHYSGVFLSN